MTARLIRKSARFAPCALIGVAATVHLAMVWSGRIHPSIACGFSAPFSMPPEIQSDLAVVLNLEEGKRIVSIPYALQRATSIARVSPTPDHVGHIAQQLANSPWVTPLSELEDKYQVRLETTAPILLTPGMPMPPSENILPVQSATVLVVGRRFDVASCAIESELVQKVTRQAGAAANE